MSHTEKFTKAYVYLRFEYVGLSFRYLYATQKVVCYNQES